MQPSYHPSIPRDDVVQFAMCFFDEPRELATKRVRKNNWGYIVKNPIPDEYGNIPLGPGPIVVHGDLGIYIALSSSPPDMIGPYSLGSLRTVEDLDAMIDARVRVDDDSIYTWIRDCLESSGNEGKSDVHQ
jgi:hypothetical protein